MKKIIRIETCSGRVYELNSLVTYSEKDYLVKFLGWSSHNGYFAKLESVLEIADTKNILICFSEVSEVWRREDD